MDSNINISYNKKMESKLNDSNPDEMAQEIRILETERCFLRPPSVDDHDEVWTAAHHEANITKGMLWDPPKTKEEMNDWTERSVSGWKQGNNLSWTIENKNTKEFLGRIVIRQQENMKNTWYMGYWIHPEQEGKGYTTEAAKAVRDAGFKIMKIDTLISSHADWNIGSGRVLAKIGMRHTGHNPKGFIKHGKNVPEEEYKMTYDEWLHLNR
ncbi:MAG: hypothetical protein JWM56_1237 [Candidatus Peribacteria bacterium]|nr:hypothetical protein [Candidatus Peribacteria bacterium]